jgi:hypothetical protein
LTKDGKLYFIVYANVLVDPTVAPVARLMVIRDVPDCTLQKVRTARIANVFWIRLSVTTLEEGCKVGFLGLRASALPGRTSVCSLPGHGW